MDFVEDIKAFELFVNNCDLKGTEVLLIGEESEGRGVIEEEFRYMGCSFGDCEVEGSVCSFVLFGCERSC